MKINKVISIALLFSGLLLFSGCTIHFHQIPNTDENTKYNNQLQQIDQQICVYYDEKDSIKINVIDSWRYSNWVYDFGKEQKVFGESVYSQYDKIAFLNIDDKSTIFTQCAFKIIPKVDKLTYTYHQLESIYADLEVEMSFLVHNNATNETYTIERKSDVIKINGLWASEIYRLKQALRFWVLDTIDSVILKVSKIEIQDDNQSQMQE